MSLKIEGDDFARHMGSDPFSDTDGGKLITAFNSMDKSGQARLLGYAEALNNHMEGDKYASPLHPRYIL